MPESKKKKEDDKKKKAREKLVLLIFFLFVVKQQSQVRLWSNSLSCVWFFNAQKERNSKTESGQILTLLYNSADFIKSCLF